MMETNYKFRTELSLRNCLKLGLDKFTRVFRISHQSKSVTARLHVESSVRSIYIL